MIFVKILSVVQAHKTSKEEPPILNSKTMGNTGSKNRILSREECLALDIETYNKAMDISWPEHKKEMNLSGDLSICEHCGRKHVICCICDKAEEGWQHTLQEVKDVANRDRSGEY